METVTVDEKVDSSFLEEATKKKWRKPESLLPVSKVHGRLPHRPLHGYPTQQHHPDDPDGDEKEVLGSSAIWFCVYCQTCGTRCPNEIHIGVLMDALREMAMEEKIPAEREEYSSLP